MNKVEGIINEAFEHTEDIVNLSWQKLTTLPSSILTLTNLNELDLRSNQLTTLPESISALTNLIGLYLSSNQLTTLSESISTLTNLKWLELNENQLTTLSESISTLTNLIGLYLNSNQLTTLSESISTLTNLNELYLSSNQLTTLPESISTLTNLKWLYLSSNQLTTLSESILTLTNLKWLYLSSNQLTTLPESISTLTNLIGLYLNSNQLTTLSESISTLTNLNELYLGGNQLTTLPESILTLTNLNELYLSYNRLTALSESTSALTNLKQLDLSSNQLTTLPESISTLTNLKWLYLNSNQLTTLPESILTLTNLTKLDLSSNQLTILSESISTLTNLKWLYLRSNQLTKPPESISTLTNLIGLYLSRNQLTTLPESISTLTNLNGLYLGGNQLTTLPESISTLTNLKWLYLSSNQLTTLPESISTLTNLKELNLSKNQFTNLPQSVLKLSRAVSITVEDNPFKFISSSVVKKGVQAIKQHYEAMLFDLKLPQKKIVIVGEGHVGKTSLIKRLKDVWFYGLQKSKRTEGVDIHSIEISKDKYISVWDFAGQEHFLSSHKLYFTKSSVFIVVVQLTDSINVIKDHLSKWLFIIHQLCPDAQVIVVATKMDLITEERLQEKSTQLDHALSLLHKELEINIVLNAGNNSKHFTISNEKSVNITLITKLLQELSKESIVHSFRSSVFLLHCIKTSKELCIGVKQLASLSDLPLQHCMNTLKHLEELGMIVYVESNADDEDATVILNGDVISKAFNKLKMRGKELTKSELTGWIDYNLAKSTVSQKIKFKMFIDVIEKAKLVYVDRQSDDEARWKIFIPHIVLDNDLQPLFEKDSASFSAGRLFYFKHQLPIGFFEHLAIQMQFFVKLASYSMMMSSFGIKIVGNASVVFIERIKLDGEFINTIRITASVNNSAPKLFCEVIEAFEECLFAYFQNNHDDVHKFVKRLVICSCHHCQVKFKSNQLTKQQYLPLTQDDSIQEGVPSILTQLIRGQKASGCVDSNASIPLTDLLVELHDLPFIDYNTIKMHKHELKDEGGSDTVRVGMLSNGQRVAVREIKDVQAAFKEIKILRQAYDKHTVKVLGYSCHESSGAAHMCIIIELIDDTNKVTLQEDAQDIPETDLKLLQKLSEGGYGEVWLAQWRGIKVAVKKMKNIIMADSFKNELKTLALLRYKYIVTLHGISNDSNTNNLMLVMEYMKHGSLDDLLFKQKVEMSLTDIIQIALDVAKGINFLHMQKPIIIHRDLKSANILLHSDKKRAKIADFGTAKALYTNVKPNTVIGTLCLAMPPEMMDEQNYDEKIDIFCFGVVLYEMLTNKQLPITKEPLQTLEKIRANVSNKDLAELIVTCCAVDPKQRPSINTIIDKLKVFKKNMPQ